MDVPESSSVLSSVITQVSPDGRTKANVMKKEQEEPISGSEVPLKNSIKSNNGSKDVTFPPSAAQLVKSPTSPPEPPAVPSPRNPRGFFSLLLCCTSRAFLEGNASQATLNGTGRKSAIIIEPERTEDQGESDRDEGVNEEVAVVEPESMAEQTWLLRQPDPMDQERKCLVLDLDETLVHSSFKAVQQADFIVPVEIENQIHNVYVIKRPGVDEFMKRMGELYEIVVFTASLAKYADPVLDLLDVHKVVRHRLFRESCFQHKGNYVKDLSQLGRDLRNVVIIDNSPVSYLFHPANAVPVSSWFSDPHDTELTDMVAFLEDLAHVEDVTMILDNTISG
ncbi:uncharacterized protein VTP21DRAFT_9460 [Calcarisporiella thermophila]|uniref:uncharacterized protein n=1 Tax=Calcarisporiella thermophila TaxID=911321 RepID=UPI003743A43B